MERKMQNEKRITKADGERERATHNTERKIKEEIKEVRDYEQEIKDYEEAIRESKPESRPRRKNIYLRRAIGTEVLKAL